MDNLNTFSFLCRYERHRKLADEVYARFPFEIRKIIAKYYLHVSDMFYRSRFPDRKVDKELIGFYINGTSMIHIIPKKDNLFSDDSIKGVIAHETAHAIIYFTFCPIQKMFYRFKYRFSPPHIKHLYASSNTPSEELYADSLAEEWGFEKEIQANNKERITITKPD